MVTLVICPAMTSWSCKSVVPCSSIAETSGSNPSFVTRTEYWPGLRSSAANLPNSSVVRRIGCVIPSPVISMRAPGTTPPEGSFTVPVIVSARTTKGRKRTRTLNSKSEIRRRPAINGGSLLMGEQLIAYAVAGRPVFSSEATKPGSELGELSFEFGPAGVEGVDGFLSGFELDAGGVEGCSVASNGGIVERRKFFCEEFFCIGDGLFHHGEFTIFFVGETFFQ